MNEKWVRNGEANAHWVKIWGTRYLTAACGAIIPADARRVPTLAVGIGGTALKFERPEAGEICATCEARAKAQA